MIFVNTPVAFIVLESPETVIVGASGAISTSSAGLATAYGDSSFIIGGSIMGATWGLLATALINPGTQFNVDVLSTGLLYGGVSGITFMSGNYRVDNAGMIKGGVAILVQPGNGLEQNLVLRNVGTLWGNDVAISLVESIGTSNLVLTNYGQIIGNAVAIDASDAESIHTITNYGDIFGAVQVTGTLTLLNRGAIEGALQTGAGLDTITNRGTIEGGISVGAGSDYVYNQRGRNDIRIDLGADDDLVYLGMAQEDVLGDTGLDMVSYAYMRAVGINLASGALNSGAAAGDTYDSIERFEGSDRGNDTLTGDAAANDFRGLGGNDILSGLEGADTLEGGAGVDTLTGGLGRDRFVFYNDLLAGDVITDFNRIGINADKIAIGFGTLAPGALAAARFVSGTDNLALDGGDRFIFRTTDQTLWSDQDGTGTLYAPVLLATLNVAALTAGDILIL